MFSKHAIRIGERVISMRIENEFWDCLRDIAADRNTTLSALIREMTANIDKKVDARRLASEIRVFILGQVMRAAPPTAPESPGGRHVERSTSRR